MQELVSSATEQIPRRCNNEFTGTAAPAPVRLIYVYHLTSSISPKLKTLVDSSLLRWCLIAIYAVAVGFTVLHHEPWADEAQAWLIARDLPFGRMLSQLHYEGTPGLWHSLLWALSHSGLPYGSMAWASWLAAVAACWFLLTYAPFPLLIRALIPFTFYLSYQFAVVARSYVLMPVLLFAAVHLIRTRPSRSLLFGVTAGLLANTNAFGLFLSAGLAIVYVWEIRKGQRDTRALFAALLPGALPYVLLAVAAFVTALPAPDLKFVPSPLGTLIAQVRGTQSANAPPPPDSHSRLWRRIQDYTTPVSHSLWVGVLFVAILVWQFRTRRMWIALVPLGFLIVSFEMIYKMPRHTGIFLVTLIALMWLVWPDRSVPLRRYRAADLACAAVFILICIPQIGWTARAIDFEVSHNYSGSRPCANYLQANARGRTVFGYDYYTVALSPYFEFPLFQNRVNQFWSWSSHNTDDLQLDRILKDKPDFVVFAWNEDVHSGGWISTAMSPPAREMRRYIEDTGYERVASFQGAQVMRSSFAERDVFEVYRRPDLTPRQWEQLESQLNPPPRL